MHLEQAEAPTYEISPVEPTAERLRSAAGLLRAAFGAQSRFDETYLRWQYADNPDGEVVGFDAFAGDEHAAHYVTIPLRAELFGAPARGLLSLNTATHPAHQGRGLFTKLARATYARGHELGYEFVIGVANASSTPGFTKKLGFQLVRQLDVRVGVGRPRYELTEAPQFRRTWSEPGVRWRMRNPATTYAARGGVVWADPQIVGMKMFLGEVPPPVPDAPAPSASRPLTAWLGAAPKLSWSGLALPVPQRLRPSPLNLIFLDLTGAGRALDPARVFFQALDFDAY